MQNLNDLHSSESAMSNYSATSPDEDAELSPPQPKGSARNNSNPLATILRTSHASTLGAIANDDLAAYVTTIESMKALGFTQQEVW